MTEIRLTLPGPPRTKKNHNRVFGKRVLPSEAYEKWFAGVLAMTYREAPLAGPVSVEALIYRVSNIGDAVGYYQAIGDAIQHSVLRCERCRREFYRLDNHIRSCSGIPRLFRKGLGVIYDDKQIVHWDGSRPFVDRKNPRIELTVRALEPGLLDRPSKGEYGEELEHR